MFDVLEIDKLLLFILFIVPGFVSLKVYELLSPSEHRDYSKKIIEALTYSCINYALLAWLLLWLMSLQIDPFMWSLILFFTLLVFPAISSCLWLWLRNRAWFRSKIPHPTDKPWDFIFRKQAPYWVVVTLNDGRRVAGKYAYGSFASSTPVKEQIYLEETWIMNKDGGFERPQNKTAGILIAEGISTIEFYKYNAQEK